MDLSGQLLPALGNDDSHAADSEERDTYQGWTMVRVKETISRSHCRSTGNLARVMRQRGHKFLIFSCIAGKVARLKSR